MMRKWMIKIGNLFILLIVLGAMIGVNISQFRCAPCNRDYVFVDIFPQEELCCCQRVKTCPIQKTAVSSDEKCGAKKKNACHHHTDSRHSFYRVSDLFQVERGVTFSFIAALPEEIVFDFSSGFVFGESLFLFPYDFFTKAPPLEWLCTYLC